MQPQVILIIFIFLFFKLNICFGRSKEPSQRDGSFKHPTYMLDLQINECRSITHSYLEALSRETLRFINLLIDNFDLEMSFNHLARKFNA